MTQPKKYRLFPAMSLFIVLSAAQCLAGGNDDPVLASLLVDQLEWRDQSGENPVAWEADLWLGRDLDKLWIKTEGLSSDDAEEEIETQVLYSRALSPFWDARVGWRADWQPGTERHWLSIGAKGLAPGFVEMEIAFFLGSEGRSALRLQAEYELLLSQRLLLVPELEVNLYGENDRDTGVGAGLADLEAGLRLRYRVTREIQPYIGFNWHRLYGNSGKFARDAGADSDSAQWVAGVRLWF